MSKNRDFFKDAIAEAKALKASAVANAKEALEEAFSPQLQAMFAKKLEEMEQEEELEESYSEEEVEEAKYSKEEMDETISETEEELDESKEEVDEDMNLDEILAELEKDEDLEESKGKSEDEDEIKEAEGEDEDVKEAEGDDDEDSEEEAEGEEAEGEEDEDIDIEDMSEEDLKSFISDVIQDMVQDDALELTDDEDEIELDSEGGEDIDIDGEEASVDMFEAKEKVKEEKVDKTELKEAYDTIKALQKEMREVNLLNAKLLYTNRLFESKEMTKTQKLKVLEAFDKAKTTEDAELIYETLNENFKPASKRKNISENIIGSASKATNMPKKKKEPIVESNEMVQRFQKLAGII